MYTSVKLLHVSLVFITAGGFVLRAFWSITDSPLRDRRIVRILPHVVDTALLCSGLSLLWLASISPGNNPWLIWKITGLVAYIVVGSIAIRYGRSARTRLLASILAATIFLYVVGVAYSKSALSWLA